MSMKRFNEKERDCLSKNKHVLRVSDKSITYANEFKQLFIDQYLEEKTPREIFEANGFDVNVLGINRVEQCAYRWKKAYDKDGIVGLADSRKNTSGRPLKRELMPDEIIAKQEARIKLFESQIELLKKLDTTERLLVARGKNLSKNKLFKLIQDAVKQGLKRMTPYLGELLNVSRWGVLQLPEGRRCPQRAGSFGCTTWRTDQEGIPSKRLQKGNSLHQNDSGERIRYDLQSETDVDTCRN